MSYMMQPAAQNPTSNVKPKSCSWTSGLLKEFAFPGHTLHEEHFQELLQVLTFCNVCHLRNLVT